METVLLAIFAQEDQIHQLHQMVDIALLQQMEITKSTPTDLKDITAQLALTIQSLVQSANISQILVNHHV